LFGQLSVEIDASDPTDLQLGVNESYTLELSPTGGTLSAPTEYGILHGLETFRQLVYWSGERHLLPGLPLTIRDAPRFPWRGLLLDSSRHFLPLDSLFQVVDGLAALKMNVLHWHFSDSQSFGLQLDGAPGLAGYGAFGADWHQQRSKSNGGAAGEEGEESEFEYPPLTYSRRDVQDLVSFAAMRGVRVVPELDVPAHTAAWRWGMVDVRAAGSVNSTTNEDPTSTERSNQGAAAADLLATQLQSPPMLTVDCAPRVAEDEISLEHGVDKVALQPTRETTFTLLRSVLGELTELFPDKFLHLGGDEVSVWWCLRWCVMVCEVSVICRTCQNAIPHSPNRTHTIMHYWANEDTVHTIPSHTIPSLTILSQVDAACWKHDEDVRSWAGSRYGWEKALQAVFTLRVFGLLQEIAGRGSTAGGGAAAGVEGEGGGGGRGGMVRVPVLWDESLDAVERDAQFMEESRRGGMVVQVWRGWVHGQLERAVQDYGYRAILSSPWYLDLTDSWDKMYKADIAPLDLPEEQLAGLLQSVQGVGQGGEGGGVAKGGLIGGEACSWGEHADALNLDHRIFQRLPSVAEKLWSTRTFTDLHKAEEEQRRRHGRHGRSQTPSTQGGQQGEGSGAGTDGTTADPMRSLLTVQVRRGARDGGVAKGQRRSGEGASEGVGGY
jgi:N-acetyl-beta-hexosaminidase